MVLFRESKEISAAALIRASDAERSQEEDSSNSTSLSSMQKKELKLQQDILKKLIDQCHAASGTSLDAFSNAVHITSFDLSGFSLTSLLQSTFPPSDPTLKPKDADSDQEDDDEGNREKEEADDPRRDVIASLCTGISKLQTLLLFQVKKMSVETSVTHCTLRALNTLCFCIPRAQHDLKSLKILTDSSKYYTKLCRLAYSGNLSLQQGNHGRRGKCDITSDKNLLLAMVHSFVCFNVRSLRARFTASQNGASNSLASQLPDFHTST